MGLGSMGDQQLQGLTNDSSEIEADANEILFERIINAKEYRNKAEEKKRNNIPIFERDIESLEDLPIFGQFLFDGKYSTFTPMQDIPVPNSYVLGSGDTLRVNFLVRFD